MSAVPIAGGETGTYSYDALGQLVQSSATGTANNVIGYDPAGNRTAYAVPGSANSTRLRWA
jgi:YD repeat-containing protein